MQPITVNKLFVITSCAVLSASIANANLIVNGGFETGDFTGWQTTSIQNTSVFPAFTFGGVDYTPHSGTYLAALGANVGDGNAVFSQDIATSAGASYLASFWLFSDGQTPNLLDVTFGSGTILDQTDIPAEGWTYYSGNFTATSSVTTLTFTSLDSPGYLGLDDVSVASTSSSVPSPAALLPFLAGALQYVAKRRR